LSKRVVLIVITLPEEVSEKLAIKIAQLIDKFNGEMEILKGWTVKEE